jgi:hypothetical protein
MSLLWKVAVAKAPEDYHPNLNDYKSGGMGHVEGDESRSVVGYVPTHTLSAMPYNETSPEGVEHYREKLRNGEGFKDPVMVMFNPDTKRAIVGEGNHRVKAAELEGISHVPTRVVRDRWMDKPYMPGGRDSDTPHAKSKWKGGMGEEYWPSDIHPSHIFKDVR